LGLVCWGILDDTYLYMLKDKCSLVVEFRNLIDGRVPDSSLAKEKFSASWCVPLENEAKEEFPHPDNRIILEQVVEAKRKIVPSSCVLPSALGESYLHESGVVVDLYSNIYFTNSEVELAKDCTAHHPAKKRMYTLKFTSIYRDKIEELRREAGLPSMVG